MSKKNMTPLCGLLNLNKPIGVTSRDVVDRVSRPLRKIKVGHAGTLDPLASGVLVVCVGPATRLIEYVQKMSKTYRAVVRLGATSDTLDADGLIIEMREPRIPSEAEIQAVLDTQVGTISQMPPQFSALKVGGKRAYDLARAGQEAALVARPVEVYGIAMLSFEWPRLTIEIDCGSGTYVRSIARDVGEALGCGGLIEVLTRTRIGPFRQDDAIDPDSLSRETIPGLLRPSLEAVADLPRISLTTEDLARIVRGQTIETTEPLDPGEVAMIGPDGELAAIGEVEPGLHRVAPRRVLATDSGGFPRTSCPDGAN